MIPDQCNPAWYRMKQKIIDIIGFITREQKAQMKKQVQQYLVTLKAGVDLLDVPIIIFERSGVVHHYNNAFSQVTFQNPNFGGKIREPYTKIYKK